MDYVLMEYYPDNVWICGDTYKSLIWKDTTEPKPTEEELKIIADGGQPKMNRYNNYSNHILNSWWGIKLNY